MDKAQFDHCNHTIIAEFLKLTECDDSQISGSIKAIMAQFLLRVRDNLKAKATKDDTISLEKLIAIQIEELRNCIIDLSRSSDKITKGVTIQ